MTTVSCHRPSSLIHPRWRPQGIRTHVHVNGRGVVACVEDSVGVGGAREDVSSLLPAGQGGGGLGGGGAYSEVHTF